MDRLHVKGAPGPARAHRVQGGGQARPRRVQAVLQGEACVRILFWHWLLFELTLKSRRDLKSGRRQSTWYKDGEALTIRVCHRKAGDPLLVLSPSTCPVHYIHSKSAMEQVCSLACCLAEQLILSHHLFAHAQTSALVDMEGLPQSRNHLYPPHLARFAASRETAYDDSLPTCSDCKM